MDEPEKKRLSINPEHFQFRNRTVKATPRQPRQANNDSEIRVRQPSRPTNSNTLKRNALLKFIRRHQANNYQRMLENGGLDTDHENTSEPAKSEIDETLEYLMGVADEIKRSENKTTGGATSSIGSPQNHSYTVRANHIPLHEQVSMSFPETTLAMPQEYHIPPSTVQPSTIALTPKPLVGSEHPQYGCLKGGSLPTYRNYVAAKSSSEVPPRFGFIPSPAGNPIQSLDESPKIPDYKHLDPEDYEFHEGGNVRPAPHTIQTDPESVRLKIQRQRRTNRRTFRIGKSAVQPTKVGILVSNRTLRKNISTKAMLLKQTPIHEIRKYLVARNLIRVGSASPDYVLRHLYENSKMLCGDIYNHNNDVLLHNFVRG
jgi:hypothetical protein